MTPSAVRTPLREQLPSVLVASLSAAFGVGLLQVTGFLAAVMRSDDAMGSSAVVEVFLRLTAIIFLVIAIYVGAVVTANTIATIVAGRARSIALLRLLGSTAGAQRRAIASEGVLVGFAGAVIGTIVGTGVAVAIARIAIAAGLLPDIPYAFVDPTIVLPIVGVVMSTWLAAWVGSRRVLTVTPMQALSGSEELSREETLRRPGRNRAALVFVIVGIALLALGILVGLASPFGVMIGLVGGVVSFTGVVLGADVVMPVALRLVGRLLGRSAPARLAAENALRHPQRSSRATIGLVIGVTLLMTFGVAMTSFQQMIHAANEARPGPADAQFDQFISALVAVFSILIGFSGVIAAVGLVNNLSLSVLQRTRELGLLRALGFSIGQLRRMILSESAQLTVTALLLGLVLGGFYGWAGAQSMLGSLNGAGLVLPTMPWAIVLIVIGAAIVLTAIASWAPTRRATRVSPITALAVE